MQTLRLTFRVNTPLFLGGARQQAELRAASIKGALRFWWRSLQWARFGSDVAALQSEEAQLFGSSDQKIGRSKVGLRIVSNKLGKKLSAGSVLWAQEDCQHGNRGNTMRPGACYLGYGAINAFPTKAKPAPDPKPAQKAAQLLRECILPGNFVLQVTLDRRLSNDQCQSIRDAFHMLGAVGGLGTCGRRGYGSLTLTQIQIPKGSHWVDASDWQLGSPLERLQPILRSTLCPHDALPEWSAWSRASRIVEVNAGINERDLLNAMGKEFLHYRSWGRSAAAGAPQVVGMDSEKNFTNDHHLFKNRMGGSSYNVPAGFDQPERTAFGLPHNYGKDEPRQGIFRGVGPADSVNNKPLDRRASPLFFHVHQASDNEPPVGIVFSLPARFLPDRILPDREQRQGTAPPRLSVFGSTVPLNTSPGFWNPVNGFLDRLIDRTDPTNPNSGTGHKKKTSLTATELTITPSGATP